MSKKRYFDTKFWSDSWIVDELNPLDRYLFMYLMTNEKTNIAGVYELPLRTMANELGLDKEEVTRMIKRLEPKVYYRDGWVVLVNAIKHQNYRNSKISEAIRRELCAAPSQLLMLCRIPADADIDLSCDITDKKMSHTRVIDDTSHLIETYTLPNTDLIKTKPIPNADVQQGSTQAKKTLVRIPTETINEMLDLWKTKMGYSIENEESNRKAIAALIRQHTKEGLMRLIDGVLLSQEDQFAPRIGDFVKLKHKQNDLLVWGRKRNKQPSKVVVI
jgi:hypothetical protein